MLYYELECIRSNIMTWCQSTQTHPKSCYTLSLSIFLICSTFKAPHCCLEAFEAAFTLELSIFGCLCRLFFRVFVYHFSVFWGCLMLKHFFLLFLAKRKLVTRETSYVFSCVLHFFRLSNWSLLKAKYLKLVAQRSSCTFSTFKL